LLTTKLIITAVIFEFYMREKLFKGNISWARAGPGGPLEITGPGRVGLS
jgi:hypothetical protein